MRTSRSTFLLTNLLHKQNYQRIFCRPGRRTLDLPLNIAVTLHKQRYQVTTHLQIVARSVLGGLHHEHEQLVKAVSFISGYIDYNPLSWFGLNLGIETAI